MRLQYYYYSFIIIIHLLLLFIYYYYSFIILLSYYYSYIFYVNISINYSAKTLWTRAEFEIYHCTGKEDNGINLPMHRERR